MFEWETMMPMDLMVGLPPNHLQSTTEYAQHLRRQLEGAYKEARWHLKQAAKCQKST